MSVRITDRPLSVDAADRALRDRTSGGVALFVGRVRPDRVRNGRVRALLYEADRIPAERELARIERLARDRFGATRVVLWHRVGELAVGEPSVIVGAATGHRAEAFTAARWLIERLKREVPIWKTDVVRPGRRRPRRRAPRAGRGAG
ncbi:MAG TPA: molybdenum cofactor biosynthesis protein MoaE [Thermoplasmata archaeon]|nr:molybdenum cofactor biosynthesis protein MoaE [Thermoplasmata archaeon]